MKVIKLRKNDNDPTDDAMQICDLMESKFGVSLYNRSAANPNDVHGYLNTSSDGSVEVYFYEQEDVEEMNPKAIANLVVTTFTDDEIKAKLDELLEENKDLELISFFDTNP